MSHPHSHSALWASSRGDSCEGWKAPEKFSSNLAAGDTETRKGDLPEVTQPRQSGEQQVANSGPGTPKTVFSAPREPSQCKATGPPHCPGWTGTVPVSGHLHCRHGLPRQKGEWDFQRWA